MKVLETLQDWQVWREAHRGRMALVPTMGNLHQGHLSLVHRAQAAADSVVVSIFVNPLQFGPKEDFATYPRTHKQDLEACEAAGVTAVFMPPETAIHLTAYPIDISVPSLKSILCGASRPQFFDGISNVIVKLFNLVRPDIAVFGEKDYQQYLIIQHIVKALHYPIEVICAPIVRADDGLAMSSRNQYLSPSDRDKAVMLFQQLQAIKAALIEGQCVYQTLTQQAKQVLALAGFDVDYIEIRRNHDLSTADTTDKCLRILGAAYLNKTRLIDNLSVDLIAS